MLQGRRLRLILSGVACAGLVQFLLALGYAIAQYPDGYSFFHNFLSDLGRTRAGGHSNELSASAFNGSLIVLGLSLLPFFALVPSTVDSGNRASLVFAFGGALSAIGLIGIGLTPYDLFFIAHHVALALWLAPMFVLAILYLLLAFDSENASPGLITCTVALILAVLAYASVGFHLGYIAMQKVTAILSIVWFAVLANRVIFTGVTQVIGCRHQIERLADRYLLRLQQGYRRGE